MRGDRLQKLPLLHIRPKWQPHERRCALDICSIIRSRRKSIAMKIVDRSTGRVMLYTGQTRSSSWLAGLLLNRFQSSLRRLQSFRLLRNNRWSNFNSFLFPWSSFFNGRKLTGNKRVTLFSINQSINQSIEPPHNQSINQSNSRSINRSIRLAFISCTSYSLHWEIFPNSSSTNYTVFSAPNVMECSPKYQRAHWFPVQYHRP